MKNGRSITEDTGIHHVKFADTDCIILEMEDVRVQPLDGLDRNLVPIYPHEGDFEVSMKGTEGIVKIKTNHLRYFQKL